MSKFTKADLRPNMTVETREAEMYMVHEFDNRLFLVKEDEWIDLEEYAEDLLHYDKVFKRFDIVTVRKPSEVDHLIECCWKEAPIIWKRKGLPELTEDEKVVLRNLGVKNEYSWLTRDKDGLLVLHKENPKKYKDDGIWRNCKKELFLLSYSKHFPFVKWVDDVPWYIPDLIN